MASTYLLFMFLTLALTCIDCSIIKLPDILVEDRLVIKIVVEEEPHNKSPSIASVRLKIDIENKQTEDTMGDHFTKPVDYIKPANEIVSDRNWIPTEIKDEISAEYLDDLFTEPLQTSMKTDNEIVHDRNWISTEKKNQISEEYLDGTEHLQNNVKTGNEIFFKSNLILPKIKDEKSEDIDDFFTEFMHESVKSPNEIVSDFIPSDMKDKITQKDLDDLFTELEQIYVIPAVEIVTQSDLISPEIKEEKSEKIEDFFTKLMHKYVKSTNEIVSEFIPSDMKDKITEKDLDDLFTELEQIYVKPTNDIVTQSGFIFPEIKDEKFDEKKDLYTILGHEYEKSVNKTVPDIGTRGSLVSGKCPAGRVRLGYLCV